jgi:hypothetical protein
MHKSRKTAIRITIGTWRKCNSDKIQEVQVQVNEGRCMYNTVDCSMGDDIGLINKSLTFAKGAR